MITKIQKWGNSLALRIPKHFARELDVGKGSRIDITARQGRLIVRPVRGRTYSLKALLAKIKKKNLHGEVRTGRKGRELL